MKNILSILLIILVFISCDEDEQIVIPETKWQDITDLDGVDIWDVKIYNDEIYVAGRSIDFKGVIYKSSDGINWKSISPLVGDSLDRGVMAIDFYNGDVIAGYIEKPVYKVTSNSIIPITKPILAYVREMVVDNKNNILIGTTGGYTCKYITSDSIYNVYDSLSTPPSGGCFKHPAIVPIAVSKFIKEINSENILIGNFAFTNHFVTKFNNQIIDCFPSEGLSSEDRYHGCHDLIFINDTLFAAGGKGTLKYFDGVEWKVFGDSIPKTPDNGVPIPTALAYDDVRGDIYLSGTYLGVIKWDNKSGWIKINDGLLSNQGFYDFIPNLIYFKNYLLLFYGTSKNYQSSLRGAKILSLK